MKNPIDSLYRRLHKGFILILLTAFIFSGFPQLPVLAQEIRLPDPGVMVHLSPEFAPAYLTGITIHTDNALQFEFLINKGDVDLGDSKKRQEYQKLIKYFLASLTIPDESQWVNLSPYEKDRIIATDFGKTEMGRDLLAQDYILKQITASLIYPEEETGKKFWDKVYALAYQRFKVTTISVDTFNKVWIVPDEAVVYESGNSAYILKSHLKVMLEEDYLALEKNSVIASEAKQSFKAKEISSSSPSAPRNDANALGSQIVREIILPELQKEVNEGKNFASLRQIYSAMILATWYKKALKESLLGKIYADKAKTKGINQNPKTNEAIYQQYLKAFKKGVYNYIKDDFDKYSQQTIPRKYFSGGITNTLAPRGAMQNGVKPALKLVNSRTVDRNLITDFMMQTDQGKLDQASVSLKENVINLETAVASTEAGGSWKAKGSSWEDVTAHLLNEDISSWLHPLENKIGKVPILVMQDEVEVDMFGRGGRIRSDFTKGDARKHILDSLHSSNSDLNQLEVGAPVAVVLVRKVNQSNAMGYRWVERLVYRVIITRNSDEGLEEAITSAAFNSSDRLSQKGQNNVLFGTEIQIKLSTGRPQVEWMGLFIHPDYRGKRIVSSSIFPRISNFLREHFSGAYVVGRFADPGALHLFNREFPQANPLQGEVDRNKIPSWVDPVTWMVELPDMAMKSQKSQALIEGGRLEISGIHGEETIWYGPHGLAVFNPELIKWLGFHRTSFKPGKQQPYYVHESLIVTPVQEGEVEFLELKDRMTVPIKDGLLSRLLANSMSGQNDGRFLIDAQGKPSTIQHVQSVKLEGDNVIVRVKDEYGQADLTVSLVDLYQMMEREAEQTQVSKRSSNIKDLQGLAKINFLAMTLNGEEIVIDKPIDSPGFDQLLREKIAELVGTELSVGEFNELMTLIRVKPKKIQLTFRKSVKGVEIELTSDQHKIIVNAGDFFRAIIAKNLKSPKTIAEGADRADWVDVSYNEDGWGYEPWEVPASSKPESLLLY